MREKLTKDGLALIATEDVRTLKRVELDPVTRDKLIEIALVG